MSAAHPMRPADERALTEALARAFRDNPLNRGVIGRGPQRRLRANRAGMRATLAAARDRCRILVSPGTGGAGPVGGLIGMGPGTWPLAPPPVLDQLRVLVGQGLRTARRWGAVYDALEAVHPREPHGYLALLGVHPDAQGHGRGAALLARWLEEIDASGVPAYLETDRPELLGFYSRFGFAPIGSEAVFGAAVQRMWREAR